VQYPFEKTVLSENETKELAFFFAENISPGKTIILNGNLGSGKTFFVKQACLLWGIKNVSSPSFSIVNSYNNKKQIYHLDFYRLKNKEELFDIGFNDYLNETEAIIFIEWGNLIPEILPHKRIEISIETLEDTKRYFRFENYE